MELREALANAIVHGNQKGPRNRVYVACRYGSEQLTYCLPLSLYWRIGRWFGTKTVPLPLFHIFIGERHGRQKYALIPS